VFAVGLGSFHLVVKTAQPQTHLECRGLLILIENVLQLAQMVGIAQGVVTAIGGVAFPAMQMTSTYT